MRVRWVVLTVGTVGLGGVATAGPTGPVVSYRAVIERIAVTVGLWVGDNGGLVWVIVPSPTGPTTTGTSTLIPLTHTHGTDGTVGPSPQIRKGPSRPNDPEGPYPQHNTYLC